MDNLMLTQLVKDFYKTKFWDKLKGDELEKKQIAESVFDFGVNAGIRTSIKLSQKVVGVLPDGVVGPKTLKAYNEAEEEEFVLKFALAKIARYAAIVNRNRSQSKFLLGWINRTLKSIE
jgi:lysozyme family protein